MSISVEVNLPALGESIAEATVVRWLKSTGDEVAVNEPLLEVSTDKVDTEIPSPVTGTLVEILVGEDDAVEVGAVVARISAESETSPAASEPVAPTSTTVVREPAPTVMPTPARQVSAALAVPADGQVAVSPSASAASDDPAPAQPESLRGKTVKMTRLRTVIAQRMVESLQASAQLTSVVEVDMTAIARLRAAVRDDFRAREGVSLSFMPFLAKAALNALKVHPSINATIDLEQGEVTYHEAEHLAIAVDTDRGLLAPVIKDAGTLSIAGLARSIADLAERTRAGSVNTDELTGGTFTLTNTGSRGALFDTPIINQPQVAILGTGAVVKRPVVIDHPELGETIAIRQMAFLALTYDHRLIDGADAARYLSDVKGRLESGTADL